MLPEAIRALRYGVALSERPEVSLLRVRGDGAFDLLDAVSPRPLFLRDAGALHTVFLNDDAQILADVYIALDDLDYRLFIEGEPMAAALRAVGGAEIVEEDADFAVLSVNGPYAWELMSRLLSPDILGIPYLSFFTLPEWEGICLRAGKTGEFGYDLVIPRSRGPELRARLLALGEDMQLAEASLDDLDLCAMENGFFSIRTPGVRALSPLDLQLQWRVDPRREFPGVELLRAACGGPRLTRALGPPQAPAPPPDAPVRWRGEPIGRVLHARTSPMLGRPIAELLLDRPLAHPGLSLECGGQPWRSVSSPLLNNRSLFIDTQRHSWASRDLDRFPPVVP